VTELTDLLEQRTERSALAYRRLAGPVVLTPKKPDIGKAYYQRSRAGTFKSRRTHAACGAWE